MRRRPPASPPTWSIDVAVGTRSGVPAGDQALALAQLVDTLPNLKLRGMLAYDGGAQHIKGYKARHDAVAGALPGRCSRRSSG